ncbi:hypothetical protein JFP838_05670 [Clostridium perfringens]|uniref:Uncharacterized protein n=2 Tax=Clostridiaceae TaxID=31979 RepID=A0A127EH13_CLOPF|nr:hypothetical protein JFP838_05670 [Clostridium perfringens]
MTSSKLSLCIIIINIPPFITVIYMYILLRFKQIANKRRMDLLIIFTLLFLVLIKLFRVKFKSVLIFLGIIMFLLLFILLNLEFFVSIASEPNADIFPTMFLLALYTTLPFQSVINLLVGYNIESLSYLILPTYMVTLSLLSYKVLKFKPQQNKQDE